MEIYKLLALQFIAHILSDFLFQSPKWSESKDKLGFKSVYLYKHVFITFIFSAVLSFSFSFIIFSLLIAVTHLLLDGFKKRTLKIGNINGLLFYFDQALHFISIVVFVYIYDRLFDTQFYIELMDLKYLLYIFAYILMLKPSNILIKEIFSSYKINLSAEELKGEELPNAGKLIGIIERLLTLTLIFLGEFAAIGFILAAKSILRYKEVQTQKAEYVLIGTMLSFGIAIITGIIISVLLKSWI